jgi:hypothetical protein
MNHRPWLRLGAKTLHDLASIAFGGALVVWRPKQAFKARQSL